MASRSTVARYEGNGGFDSLNNGVNAALRGTQGGAWISIVDRGDGTAEVTVAGPSSTVDAVIDWVNDNF
jgi:hypothetical protein